MHYQNIMLCLTAFISLSTCNRVYVHPFNLLTYTKSECEKIQSQDHSTEKMFFPTAIESKNNAEETDFKLQTNQEASDLGTPETYLISLISDFGFRAVAQWWKLNKMDNILIPYTDLFRTMVSFYHGASGNTSSSLQAFLGFQDPSLIPNCTFKVNGLKVIPKLKKIDNFLFSRESNINTLRTVCIFVSNVPLSEKFVHGLIPTAENFYVKAVDFKDSPKAIKLINEFLDAKLPTNTKSGLTSIDGTTNFMYFSHVQFKGKVAKSFLIPNHQPFWTELNKRVMVPMISVSGIFQFIEDNTANQLIIKISLTDNDFLLLVQPINGNTLENIESSMERDTYVKWVNSLPKKYTYINLSLPKLKIQHSYNIQDLLESLNVSYLLGKNADFSGMSNTNIKVGKVINMIDFELEETGVEPNGDSDVPQTKEEPVELKLNTPFLFAICEGTTKSLLLLGRVVHPTNVI
ncbi:angiotensinogen [Hyla sarda]|uniref:angiotensinogen n=1 Tax=Hyla sarda TaxID=327740 RepID=UPI0024C3933B|nr:angiotensinogen [Hyla sarda]